MFNVLIIGAPGVGKGTQSKKLSNDDSFKSKDKKNTSGLVHLSTGELLRKEMESESELGKFITDTMNSGKYVSDEIASQTVMNFILSHDPYTTDGFVFDGYPRTLKQCDFLDSLLAKYHEKLNVVIHIKVEGKVLVKRLLERGKTSGRPEDADKAVIIERLKVYAAQTEPIIEHYKLKGLLIEVDGNQSEEEVYNSIMKLIDTDPKN